MQLVAPLASGVNGASGGTATLLKRGTATQVTAWYADFEATQPKSGVVTLDANGGAVVYVNELVDVQVRDLNGVLMREFVAADNATAVEVISPAFTGTDYVTGQVAANKPTTLSQVFALLATSAGTTNWNVLVNGTPVSLQTAFAGLSGLYFNVQTYGAKGDSTTDNASFITAAVAAATAAGGGTVFFPPGVYRSTTVITVPVNVSILGCGGNSSKLAIDSGSATAALSFTGADSGSRSCVGMWFGAINQNFVGTALVTAGDVGTRVDVVSCMFGNDTFSKGPLFVIGALGVGRVIIDKCTFALGADTSAIFQTSYGRVVVRDSDLFTTFSTALTNSIIFAQDGCNVDNCRFDANTVSGGSGTYISFQPLNMGGCTFTNNRFRVFNGVVAALYNRGSDTVDCFESGNFFGEATNGSCPPYAYVTDGTVPNAQDIGGGRFHGTRIGRLSNQGGFNTNLTLHAKAYGIHIIQRTAGGAQTLSADVGTVGDPLTVQIVNNSGGVVAPAFGTNFIMRGGYVANINNLAMRVVQFQWISDQTATGGGAWVQIGVET